MIRRTMLTDNHLDAVAQAAYEAWRAYARATCSSGAAGLPVYGALDASTRARLRARVIWSLGTAPTPRDRAHEQLFTAVARSMANSLAATGPEPTFADFGFPHGKSPA